MDQREASVRGLLYNCHVERSRNIADYCLSRLFHPSLSAVHPKIYALENAFQKLNFLNFYEKTVKKSLQKSSFLQKNAYILAKKTRNFPKGIDLG